METELFVEYLKSGQVEDYNNWRQVYEENKETIRKNREFLRIHGSITEAHPILSRNSRTKENVD